MYLRRLAAVTAAVTMTAALGACTSDDSDDGETPAASSSAAPEAAPDLPEAAVGDALAIGDATLTVHMITRAAECDYGSDGELPAGAELVQLRAEVDKSGDVGATLDPVDVVNEDGSSADWPAEMKDGGTGCIQADHSDDYVNWEEELPVGGPTYVYGNIAVPEGAGFLNIGGYRFEIPEDEVDDVEAPDPTPGVDEGVMPEDTDGTADYGSTEPDPATIPYADGGDLPRLSVRLRPRREWEPEPVVRGDPDQGRMRPGLHYRRRTLRED